MSSRNGSSEQKSKKLNRIIIVLLVAIIASSAFFGIAVWEKKKDDFQATDPVDKIDSSFEYDGKKYDLNEDVQTLLLLGLDKFEQDQDDTYSNNMQADFVVLLVIDNKNEKCTALHINRDSMVDMSILGIAGDKVDVVNQQLALAHTYGNGKEISCRNTAEAVSNLLLGVEVDHYMSVTMDAVTVYNDYVGGVDVEVMDDFSGIDDTLIKGKTVTLTGQHALNYVRSRQGLDDSTNNRRMERQRQYIEALYNKTTELYNENESFAVNALSKISEYLVSDCSGTRLQELAEKIAGYKLTGIISLEGDYVQGERFMEFYPDGKYIEETIVKLFYTPID